MGLAWFGYALRIGAPNAGKNGMAPAPLCVYGCTRRFCGSRGWGNSDGDEMSKLLPFAERFAVDSCSEDGTSSFIQNLSHHVVKDINLKMCTRNSRLDVMKFINGMIPLPLTLQECPGDAQGPALVVEAAPYFAGDQAETAGVRPVELSG